MKRILISFLTIAIVGGAGVAATRAFFSDTETSVGNTLAAGEIDLKIGNTSYYTDANGVLAASQSNTWSLKDLVVEKFFDFADVKPGDIGEDTISVQVGSNNAWLCAAARITDDSDQTCTEPELTDDPTCVAPNTNGELDDQVNFAFWVDDGDNVFEDDESIFLDGPLSMLGVAGKIALADANSSIFGSVNPVSGGTNFYIGKAWCFGRLTPSPSPQDHLGTGTPLTLGNTGFNCVGSGVNNAAQTDRVVGDLQFYAVQSRNNDSFTCSEDYTPTWSNGEEPEVKVGSSAVAKYEKPVLSDCNDVVHSGQSIQTAIDNLNSNTLLCIDDGVYDQDFVLNKEGMTLASLNGLEKVTIAGSMTVAADKMTVKGFTITGGPTSEPGFSAIYVQANTTGHTLRDNLIDGDNSPSSRGILFGFNVSNTLVTNNYIQEWVTGSYVNPTVEGNIDFTFNDFRINTVAIGSDGMNNADITNNEFKDNTAEAIGAGDYQGNVTGNKIHNNNFIPAGTGNNVNVYELNGVNTLGPIDAENNFWDSEIITDRTNNPAVVDTDPAVAVLYPHI